MKYKHIIEGKFISRPNKFMGYVDINGTTETVHIKNTGRCKELLLRDSIVFLNRSDNLSRKTKYDLVSIIKNRDDGTEIMINMDSQMPNDLVEEWLRCGNLFSKDANIRREVRYGSSRFDFYVEDQEEKYFIEVKGVTLESDGIAMFPDAPTERGVKHINELISCLDNGYKAYIIFVIQMKGVRLFTSNRKMHREFADALRKADAKGVKILAVDCTVTESEIKISERVDIKF